MQFRYHPLNITSAILVIFNTSLAIAFSQGTLNPPQGPTQPTQKSLLEIWDRIDALEERVLDLTAEVESNNELLLQFFQEQLPWDISTLDPGGIGSHLSLAFGPNGEPSISSYDSQAGDLHYAKRANGVWEFSNPSTDGDVGQGTSLAFGPGGFPAIAFYDQSNGDLKYTAHNGTSWIETTVDSAGVTGRWPSLAFGPNDLPAIAYFDETNANLRFAISTPSGWTAETVDASGNVGKGASLQMGASGQISIAYLNDVSFVDSEVKYATYNGKFWEISVVADNGYYTGPSLAIAESGLIAVAYINQDTGQLTYAALNGSTWVTSIVDEECSGTTSLAFGDDNRPAVAYLKNGGLNFAKFNGSTWAISSFNDTGGSAAASSLKFDSTGNPSIAFWDDSQLRLRLAERTTLIP